MTRWRKNRVYWGRAAAGILPVARATGRFLVALRSGRVMEPHTWGVIGGKVEPGESPTEAAVREFREETRSRARIELAPLFVYRDDDAGFSYHNHLGVIPREFKPRRNWETDQWAWLSLEELLELEPKHYGLEALLSDEASLRALSGEAPVGNPAGERYLYHVTYLFNLPGISKGGLRPGAGQTFRGTWYEGYSRGWLHLTASDGVAYWVHKLEEHAEANTDHPEEGWVPVVVSITVPRALALEPDEVGTRDSLAQAWRTQGSVPVRALTYWDGMQWAELSVSEDDAEDMRTEWLATGEQHFDEDDEETSWWEDLDFEFFLPPDEELVDEGEG